MPAKLMHSQPPSKVSRKKCEVEKKVENHEQSFFFRLCKKRSRFVASDLPGESEKNVSEFILNFAISAFSVNFILSEKDFLNGGLLRGYFTGESLKDILEF